MKELKDMRFLIADDMENILLIVKTTLKQMSCYNVATAKNGRIAMNILQNEKIDFIISDWNMPLISGLELLQWVRKEDNIKNLPFLMITAEMNKDNVITAVQGGVNGYIVKPFTPDHLMSKIKEILKE
jgi:two-component system chemotaxis response regulator CheY